MCNFQLPVFTTVITLLLLLHVASSKPVVESENNDIVEVLYRKLEEALTKNSTLLFQLQKLFLFGSRPKSCYNAKIVIEVGTTLNRTAHTIFHKCTNHKKYECEYGNWTSGYNYYTICPQGVGAHQASQLLLGDHTTSLLEAFDPLFYNMITSFSITNRNDANSGIDCDQFQSRRPVPDITLRLFIDTIDILPLRDELSEAEIILLSLAKGYAKTNGHLTETQYSELSTVKRIVYCQIHFVDELLWVFLLVLAIFYSLNILVLGLVIKYIHQSLCWLYTQDKEITGLYAIIAAIAALLNSSSFIVRVALFAVEGVQSSLLLALSFVVPIVVIEVIVVVYHTCRRISTHQKKFFYRCLHFFACCNIIWFIHRLATDTIIATLNFITSPALTISVVSIYLSTIAGTIITLTLMISRCGHGISRCSKDCCKQFLSLSFVLMKGVSAIVLMISAGFLYIILVNYRLDTAEVGALLLSFVQPVVFIILGVYIKKTRFHKFFEENESMGSDEQGTSAEMKDMFKLQEKETSLINKDKSIDTIQQSDQNGSTNTTAS